MNLLKERQVMHVRFSKCWAHRASTGVLGSGFNFQSLELQLYRGDRIMGGLIGSALRVLVGVPIQ